MSQFKRKLEKYDLLKQGQQYFFTMLLDCDDSEFEEVFEQYTKITSQMRLIFG